MWLGELGSAMAWQSVLGMVLGMALLLVPFTFHHEFSACGTNASAYSQLCRAERHGFRHGSNILLSVAIHALV